MLNIHYFKKNFTKGYSTSALQELTIQLFIFFINLKIFVANNLELLENRSKVFQIFIETTIFLCSIRLLSRVCLLENSFLKRFHVYVLNTVSTFRRKRIDFSMSPRKPSRLKTKQAFSHQRAMFLLFKAFFHSSSTAIFQTSS